MLRGTEVTTKVMQPLRRTVVVQINMPGNSEDFIQRARSLSTRFLL